MQNITVKLKKLNQNAIVPKYGTPYAAGADLYACEGKDVLVEPHQTVFIHTGIAVAIPDGMVGLIYARSGLASKRSLAPANKVGVIDSDYRGEIIVSIHNHGDVAQIVADKERIAQLVIAPYYTADFVEDELDDTTRGANGFGSTGKL